MDSTSVATLVISVVISVVILAALIGRAFWDHSVLASRGRESASGWWMDLAPPIGYLVARRAVLKRQGIRANAPSNVYVLTAVAVGLIGFFALTPLADAQRGDASVVGSTFDCTAADTTGRSVKVTVHVVRPREFSVDAPVLQ